MDPTKWRPLIFFALSAGLLIGSASLSGLLPEKPGWTASAVFALLYSSLQLLWVYRAWTVATARSRVRLGLNRFLFALPICCSIIVIAINYSTLAANGVEVDHASPAVAKGVSTAVIIGAASFFLSLWLAARAIVAAEGDASRARLASTLGTFLLLVYLFIAVWWLKPRVDRLTSSAPPV